MNFRYAIDSSCNPVARGVEFSDGCTHFAVAADDGFRIYSSDTCDLYIHQELSSNLGDASLLGTSQIVGFTSPQDPNRLTIFDSAQRNEVASVKTKFPIIRSCLSENHIAIVCEHNVNLYRHQPSIEKLGSYETYSNILGLCCLGSKALAFPGRTAGQIQAVNLRNLTITIIPAHTSALRALALGQDNLILASASQNGTLVRLHSVSTAMRLGELRRGVAAASIYSLAISPSGRYLALTSDTNTLHIFHLPQPADKTAKQQRQSLESNSSPQRRSDQASQDASAPYLNLQKWGGLSKIPFAPRLFSDFYSFVTATFDPGREDDRDHYKVQSLSETGGNGPPSSGGNVGKGTRKGVVGWIDDETLVVISAGADARYERFALDLFDSGQAVCRRVGWSRFMRPN